VMPHQTYCRDLHIVVGLGLTGWSCVRYLLAQNKPVAVIDTRECPPSLLTFRQTFPDVPVFLGGLDHSILPDAAVVVLSPGVSAEEPAIRAQAEKGAVVLGDIELFARAVRRPVVAITGSNGKSTVTTLVGDMVKAAGLTVKVGGNIGTPALDLLTGEKPDLYVVELSSFQLETTESLLPAVAVVLNICSDHLDRHVSMQQYIRVKQRIYRNVEAAIINRDDLSSYSGVKWSAQPTSFGLDEPEEGQFGVASRGGKRYLCHGQEQLVAVDQMLLRAEHQVANALAALALGHHVGLPMSAMVGVLKCFVGLEHRCQFVGKLQGVRWYDDSKATNLGAALAAINSLSQLLSQDEKLILIAGGIAKEADFSPLRVAVADCTRAVILLGRDAEKIGAALQGVVELYYVKTMDAAVRRAAALAKSNDIGLLAPAINMSFSS